MPVVAHSTTVLVVGVSWFGSCSGCDVYVHTEEPGRPDVCDSFQHPTFWSLHLHRALNLKS